jgi:protein-S-isoprenylcysteine O-methyltransferase Ste14
MSIFPERFSQTRTFDTLAVLPLILFYAFAVAGLAIEDAPALKLQFAHFDAAGALALAAHAALAAFLGLQIALFLIRRPPSAKAQGVLPRLAALVGANLGVAFLVVPRAAPSAFLSILSIGLTLAGMLGAIYVALWLKRAFAIFPQARELVTAGPYRVVRHPLYLAELVATCGIMLQFRQPWSALVTLAVVAAQFPRMHFEEEILGETFPAYRAYKAKTARLIPGVY